MRYPLLLSFFLFPTLLYGYTYRKSFFHNHKVHSVEIDPKAYTMRFVKSGDALFQRETVNNIAQRCNARLAINGGFFYSRPTLSGRPRNTLVIENDIYNLTSTEHPFLAITKNGAYVIEQDAFPTSVLLKEKTVIQPDALNRAPLPHENILFTPAYGTTTQTPYADRIEICFDQQGNYRTHVHHGCSPIPHNGYVVSVSKKTALPKALQGLRLAFPSRLKNYRAIMAGNPLLLKGGKIPKNLYTEKDDFHRCSYARAAVGITPEGKIILVIAENRYRRDSNTITMREIEELIERAQLPQALPITQVRTLVEKNCTYSNSIVGFTTLQLARYMRSLGCREAINLCGGGVAHLWIEGKTVNKLIGDTEEAMGIRYNRPASSAIVFHARE